MQVVVAKSIEVFDRDEWNRLFHGERGEDLEDWSFYRAVEQSHLPGFDLLYFGLRENGALRAAVPAFVTDYRLDTTLTGPMRRFTDGIARVLPRLLTQRMLCLGSPVGEICHLGFAPDCSEAEQANLLETLFAEVEKEAAQRRVSMVATKDAAADQDRLWSAAGAKNGLRRQPSLPTACLDIRFDSIDDYLATLSSATRKDLRRKMKAAAALRVEWRSNVDDIIDDVMRLYHATLANAELSFEELTPDFFRQVLANMGSRASCATYWVEDKLIAFNLVLHDGTTLLDKFLGMDYEVARRYNLYYVTWLHNVRYCIEHGVAHYQAGQGLHQEKARLGSRLTPNWLWYRHRNRVVDKVFATFEHLVRLDRDDPALTALLPPATRVKPSQIAAWCGFLACAAMSQIAFKYAGQHTGEFEFSLQWFTLALGSVWLWVSVASHIGEFILWMSILSKSALSSAFATTAVLFIVIMLASRVLFGEPLGWAKLLGSAVILCGIVMLGSDHHPPESDATSA
jgi:predicted N-acyltransferase/multidrug transporter EmrE-like cation transporter